MTPTTATEPAEPAQLSHERDRLGFVPLALAGRYRGSHGFAALYSGTVQDVHKHAYADYHTLTFALGGAPLLCVDPHRGLQAEMSAGTVTVQPAEVESIWRSHREARWLQFYVSTEFVRECAARLAVPGPDRLTLERRPAIENRAAVRTLYRCALDLAAGIAGDAAAFDEWVQSLTEHLLTTHTAPSLRPRASPLERFAPAQITAAHDYIAAHLGPGLTASAVATALGVSRFQFTRAYLAATGETPYQVIQRERLRAARRRVAGTDTPLADIAYDLGFAHQGHMSAVFTRELGISPSKVRALAQGPAHAADSRAVRFGRPRAPARRRTDDGLHH